MSFAIAFTAEHRWYGEVIEEAAGYVRLKEPFCLVEQAGKVEGAIQRHLLPPLGSIRLPSVTFGPPWAIVSDRQMEKHWRALVAKLGGVLTAAC